MGDIFVFRQGSNIIWTLAKPNQAKLPRSGEMGLLARKRSPISPDLSNVAWLGLAK